MLSNERTLLSYVRTSLSAFILAFALFEFFNSEETRRLGLIFFIIGVAFLFVGIVYFLWRRKRILDLHNQDKN